MPQSIYWWRYQSSRSSFLIIPAVWSFWLFSGHSSPANKRNSKKRRAKLESISGTENTYSLMQVFGRGHQVTRNEATAYVTRCQQAEVTPRSHTNCTVEIPAEYNSTYVFVDPISFVTSQPVSCNDIVPLRWRLCGWALVLPLLADTGLQRAREYPLEADCHVNGIISVGDPWHFGADPGPVPLTNVSGSGSGSNSGSDYFHINFKDAQKILFRIIFRIKNLIFC
jgi:hypothetical protein